MKTLELNQMEELQGGWSWSCAAGIGGLAFVAVGAVSLAVFNPALGAAVFLSGEGAMVAAGITATGLALISDC